MNQSMHHYRNCNSLCNFHHGIASILTHAFKSYMPPKSLATREAGCLKHDVLVASNRVNRDVLGESHTVRPPDVDETSNSCPRFTTDSGCQSCRHISFFRSLFPVALASEGTFCGKFAGKSVANVRKWGRKSPSLAMQTQLDGLRLCWWCS